MGNKIVDHSDVIGGLPVGDFAELALSAGHNTPNDCEYFPGDQT